MQVKTCRGVKAIGTAKVPYMGRLAVRGARQFALSSQEITVIMKL